MEMCAYQDIVYNIEKCVSAYECLAGEDVIDASFGCLLQMSSTLLPLHRRFPRPIFPRTFSHCCRLYYTSLLARVARKRLAVLMSKAASALLS